MLPGSPFPMRKRPVAYCDHVQPKIYEIMDGDILENPAPKMWVVSVSTRENTANVLLLRHETQTYSKWTWANNTLRNPWPPKDVVPEEIKTMMIQCILSALGVPVPS